MNRMDFTNFFFINSSAIWGHGSPDPEKATKRIVAPTDSVQATKQNNPANSDR